MTYRLLPLLLIFSFLVGCAHLTSAGNMRVHVLRLAPGEDPRSKLDAFVAEKKIEAAVVVSAVGSLTKLNVRFANQQVVEGLSGHFEIVSLTGTLSATGGSHLHISVTDEKGKALGGHLATGSAIYTTLEVAVGELSGLRFTREIDPATTFKELKISR